MTESTVGIECAQSECFSCAIEKLRAQKTDYCIRILCTHAIGVPKVFHYLDHYQKKYQKNLQNLVTHVSFCHTIT